MSVLRRVMGFYVLHGPSCCLGSLLFWSCAQVRAEDGEVAARRELQLQEQSNDELVRRVWVWVG